MIIPEIFHEIAWDTGYGTVNKTINARGASLVGDVKLTLPGQNLQSAAFKCKINFQARTRDFLRQCERLDQEMREADMLDATERGWHEQLFASLRQQMIERQRRNTTWEQKYMRFGVGRFAKTGPGPGYGPLIPGVIGGYDPGTGMFGVTVGRFTAIEELAKEGLSARQQATNTVSAGFVLHRKIAHDTSYNGAIDAMRTALRAGITGPL